MLLLEQYFFRGHFQSSDRESRDTILCVTDLLLSDASYNLPWEDAERKRLLQPSLCQDNFGVFNTTPLDYGIAVTFSSTTGNTKTTQSLPQGTT